MEWILLTGALFNAIGGAALILPIFVTPPSFVTPVPSADEIHPRDYMQYRLFAAGTAFAFGAMYLYLFIHPEFAIPFLYFGMFLKYWAFISSLFAIWRYDLPKDVFIGFGCSNGCVALLFTVYCLAV